MNYVSSNMSMKKRIIKAIVIILILTLLIVLAILKFTNNNKKTNTSDNKIETSIKNYAYLLNRLYPNSCAVENITEYSDLNNLSNDVKIEVAISSLTPKTVKINENDEFDLYNNEKIDFEWLKQFVDFGFTAKDVDNKIKEIFGSNVIVQHKSTDDVYYDKTTQVYIDPPHGCGDYNNGWFQSMTNVEEKDNELYIYTIAGSTINRADEISKVKLCYSDNYKDLDQEKSCILLTSIDKKYKSNDDFSDLEYDYEQYALDNKDKFTGYKYTFIKEGNNYIIKNLEKIK